MQPVTLTDPKPVPSIEFVMTPQDRDLAQRIRLDLIAQKMHRDPEGFEVGEASEADWIAAGGLPL